MSLYLNFKEKLAIEFGDLLGRRVEPSELVLGERLASPAPATYDSVIEVTAAGVTRKLAYMRCVLSTLFPNLTGQALVLTVPEDADKLYDVLPILNLKYGTSLTEDDVEDADIVPGTFPLTMKAKPNSLAYSGQGVIYMKRAGTISSVRPPNHRYLLASNSLDTGTDPKDMTIPFNYVDVNGQKLASIIPGGSQVFGNGARLKVCGEFTLDFTVLINGNYGYLYMMTCDQGGTGNSRTFGAIAFYGNKLYQYGVTPSGSAQWQNEQKPVQANVPTRITLHSAGGIVTCYLNGVKTTTWNAAAEGTYYLTGFRDADSSVSQWPSGCLVSNISSWEFGLTPDELKLMFDPEGYAAGYPTPTHRYKFDGNQADTGMSPQPMTIPFTYRTVAGKKFACVPGTAPVLFGNDLQLRVCGDFTLDFEVAIGSAAASYLYMMVPDINSTAAGTKGALVFYGLKFYHYLLTSANTGSTWDKITPVLEVDKPARITLRSKNGTTMMFINGEYLHSWPSAALNEGITLKGFRDKSYLGSVTQWPDNNGLANFNYWDTGLTNAELYALFGKNKASPIPLHHWPLRADGGNIGTDMAVWTPPMTYALVGKDYMASVNGAAGYSIGTVLDFSKEFTLQFEYRATSAGTGLEGIFSDSAVGDAVGALKINYGDFMFVGNAGNRYISTHTKIQTGDVVLVTFMRDADGIVHCWVNDQYMGYCGTFTPVNITHFGKATQALRTANQFANMKFWPISMTALQLKEVIGSAAFIPDYVIGLANRGGNTQLVDGSWAYPGGTFNATSNPTATGEFADSQVGRQIVGLDIASETDATNYKKKIKDVYIDFWDDTVGGYVNAGMASTTYARNADPKNETIYFTKPITITHKKVRYRCVGNWADQFGYRWVYEIIPFIQNTPITQIRNPLHAWMIDDTLVNRGSAAGVDLTADQFQTKTYQGDVWAEAAADDGWATLPTELDVSKDFTIDVELLVTPYAGDIYGSIFSFDKSAVGQVPGHLITWRNIATGYKNAPVLQSIGHSGYADCKWLPPFGTTKARFTLRRKGHTWTWYRNGVQVWEFLEVQGVLKPWKLFGSIGGKRDQQLLRKFRWWDSALSNNEMNELFKL